MNTSSALKQLDKSKSNTVCYVSTSRLEEKNSLLDVVKNKLKYTKYDGVMACQASDLKYQLKFEWDRKKMVGKFAVSVTHSNNQLITAFAVLPTPRGWRLILYKENKVFEQRGADVIALSRPIKKEVITQGGTLEAQMVSNALRFLDAFSKKFFGGVLKAKALTQEFPEIEEKIVEFFLKGALWAENFVTEGMKSVSAQKSTQHSVQQAVNTVEQKIKQKNTEQSVKKTVQKKENSEKKTVKQKTEEKNVVQEGQQQEQSHQTKQPQKQIKQKQPQQIKQGNEEVKQSS